MFPLLKERSLKFLARALRFLVAALAWLGVPTLGAQTAPHAQLMVQSGHDQVNSAAFSPNGRWLVIGGVQAQMWDVETARELRRFTGHTGIVSSVAFSPDGRRLLTGSIDGARLWDVESGKELRHFEGHFDRVGYVAFSRDRPWVLTASWNETTVRLWDMETGKEVQHFVGLPDQVESMAISPDKRKVLTGSRDGSARLWDIETGKALQRFKENSEWVTSVVFSPDGHRILTGDSSNAYLWDVETGKGLQRFPGWGHSVSFSPDGRKVLTGSGDGDSRLWDVETRKELQRFEGRIGDAETFAFSPNGKSVFTGSENDTTRLWDVATGKELRRFEGNSWGVRSVAYSIQGRELLTSSFDGTASLWDLETGNEQQRFGEQRIDEVWPVAFSPDGRRLLIGKDPNMAQLWDLALGKEVQSFDGHSARITSVAFSDDGRRVLTGSDDKTARLWDVESGKELKRFTEDAPTTRVFAQSRSAGSSGSIYSTAFTPDSRRILTGSDDCTVRLWDVETGKEVQRFVLPEPVDSVSLSSDGHKLLTNGDDKIARLWDLQTGKVLQRFEGHLGVIRAVAFSLDAQKALTGSWDNTARLWDVETGRELRRFVGHSDVVNSVTSSPNGRFILTASSDGTTKLWDAETEKELASLFSFTDGAWAAVDPEGRFDTSDLDGGAPMHWIVDDDPFRPLPLEIFMRDYYTPRLLSRIMNGETLPPIRSIAQITNRVQPDVSIVSVAASKTHPGRADVVVRAASHTNEKGQPSGLEDLRLFRNGQLVGYLEGSLKNGDFTFPDIQLPTSAKSVAFTAYGFNSMNIKSATAQKDYAYEPSPAAKPHAYLLQIGVNHYQATGCELHGSATDAEKLSEILTERLTARGLDVKLVRLISTDTENAATKENIRKALAAIAAVAGPDDVFFLSFSGHGYGDKNGQFYILPSDVQGSCQGVDDAMLRSAISADELTEWLRPIDAGEMTFILDSCDSASSVEANDFKPGPMGSRGLGQLAYDKRMRILAASQSNQAARESDSLHQGLLSYALTKEGLVEGKADWKPVDQKITVGEWLSYAANEVPKYREAGAVETGKGVKVIGAPVSQLKSAQIPAVFDFSKKDTFVLQ